MSLRYKFSPQLDGCSCNVLDLVLTLWRQELSRPYIKQFRLHFCVFYLLDSYVLNWKVKDSEQTLASISLIHSALLRKCNIICYCSS